MRAKNVLASLVAVFLLVLVLAPTVSAFATINGVWVDGIFYEEGESATVTAGETVAIAVKFTANEDKDDVRVYARIIGEPGLSEATERFDVIAESTYRENLHIGLPYKIDPDEERTLEISIETEDGSVVEYHVDLNVQRSNYEVEILSVNTPSTEVEAGESVALDIVLKNRGRHEAEDTFVEAEIPVLGINTRAYFGDLAPKDPIEGVDEDEHDSAERRMYLMLPSNVETGVYEIEVTAYNDDSTTTVIKRIVVVGSTDKSTIYSGSNSDDFAVGSEGSYSITLVNAGDEIKIYELIVDADEGLNVDFDESIVVVPAGSARTVKFTADASKEGNYGFTVNVHSDEGLIQTENFTARVEGTSFGGDSAAVVLTIILAIIFIVLLIVLIVLLTRKPEKNEEFGESYY